AVVFAALKSHRFQNVARPLSAFKICKTLICHLGYGNIVNWLSKPSSLKKSEEIETMVEVTSDARP
ncbi:MAG: hypothetical protein Q8P95_04745, partial [bacterium]|nr:hypothetical protein [bacterium]